MKKPKAPLEKVGPMLKQASPTILTCVGAVGMIATVVLAVKATPKALAAIEADSEQNHDGDPEAATKLEAVKSGYQFYILATIVGIASLTCIFSATILNRKQQASLTSACALLCRSYNDYKRKVVELYGKEAHEKILESLSAEKVDKDHFIFAQGLVQDSCLDFEGAVEEERLFYDSFSERYFTSTISKVLQAEYHLNRNFSLNGGEAMLNNFYSMLGIEEIKGGDSIGWFATEEMYWIDFNHHKIVLNDGLECWIIDMIYTPGTYEDYCENEPAVLPHVPWIA